MVCVYLWVYMYSRYRKTHSGLGRVPRKKGDRGKKLAKGMESESQEGRKKNMDFDMVAVPRIGGKGRGYFIPQCYDGTQVQVGKEGAFYVILLENDFDPREDNYGYLKIRITEEQAREILKGLANLI